MSDERRKLIIDKIQFSANPITGAELAEFFSVSRQVIVQDIAIIRASGIPILATTNGYLVSKSVSDNRIIKTFVSRHEGLDKLEEELQIIIDYGGKIIDVIVEHPVYGEIVGTLHINNQLQLDNFIEKVKRSNAKPLSILTCGDHFHTIEVPSDKVYQLIIDELTNKGFIK